MRNKANKLAIGHLLVSGPKIEFEPLNRAVVLVVNKDDNGIYGLILNKITDLSIGDIEESGDFDNLNFDVYLGGLFDIGNSLFYIHTLGDRLPGSREIAKGIYFDGNRETLRILLKGGHIKKNQIRFFSGFTFWANRPEDGEELEVKNWGLVRSTEKFKSAIFSDDIIILWQYILDEAGSEYAVLGDYLVNFSNN